REQLADVDARDVGADGVELAANLARGLDLDVPHVQVRRSTRKVDIDDRFMTAGALLGLGPQQIGQRQPAQQGAADGEKIAPRHAVAEAAVATRFAEDRQHEWFQSGGKLPDRRISPRDAAILAGTSACTVLVLSAFCKRKMGKIDSFYRPRP